MYCFIHQVLADKIAVGCTLTRGEYNRAWNEVMLPDCDDTVSHISDTLFVSLFIHTLYVLLVIPKILVWS